MSNEPQEARARLEGLGIAFEDDQWEALPAAARRRLALHPTGSDFDRRSLRELARWLCSTFPPGWSHAG